MSLLLCAVYGLVVELARGAAVRQPCSNAWLMATVALGIIADQQRALHLRKEPRGLALPWASASLGDRRPARLAAAARDTGGWNRTRGGRWSRVFQKGKTGQAMLAVVQNVGRRAPDGHQRAARDHGEPYAALDALPAPAPAS